MVGWDCHLVLRCGSERVLEDENDGVSAQEQLRNETVLRHGLGLKTSVVYLLLFLRSSDLGRMSSFYFFFRKC